MPGFVCVLPGNDSHREQRILPRKWWPRENRGDRRFVSSPATIPKPREQRIPLPRNGGNAQIVVIEGTYPAMIQILLLQARVLCAEQAGVSPVCEDSNMQHDRRLMLHGRRLIPFFVHIFLFPLPVSDQGSRTTCDAGRYRAAQSCSYTRAFPKQNLTLVRFGSVLVLRVFVLKSNAHSLLLS